MSGPLPPFGEEIEAVEAVGAHEAEAPRFAGEPEPARASAAAAGPVSSFTKRVTAIFATRVTTLMISLFTSVLIAKLLDIDQRGVLVVIATLPGMLSAIGLFGLPSAVNYFAGRGNSVASLVRASIILTIAVSIVLVVGSWLALPWLEQSVLKAVAAQDQLARVMLLTLPVGMAASFGGTLLYGRQQVRVYNIILVCQAIGSLIGAVLMLGVFRLGVPGAIASSIVVSVLVALGVMWEVSRLRRRDTGGQPVGINRLVTYGGRVYPASIMGFFNARADVYIIQALAATDTIAKTNVSLYGWAVTMAELVFYVPESVATMFLPKVAGSSHQDASEMLGRVARLTILVSIVVGVALIPMAFIGIHLVLPKYADCLPAFVAILPGVISLSVAKVMTSYLGGRGRPGLISIASTIALVTNVVANLILISMYGIVGAALSSVISYAALAILVVMMASRVSGVSPLELCVPRPADFRMLATVGLTIARRAISRGRKVAKKAV
jgi:O-antigen/teichoic acid export membrane protein